MVFELRNTNLPINTTQLRFSYLIKNKSYLYINTKLKNVTYYLNLKINFFLYCIFIKI